jgi:DNA-binding NarL/FixJ family response regulator
MLLEKCMLFLSVGVVPLLLLLLMLVLGAAVYAFLVIKVELRLLAKRAVGRAELESALRQAAGELEALRQRLREVEREWRNTATATAEPEFFNLNRRAQIFAMRRKGKQTQEIASALHIPQGEVELMVKVHELSQTAGREIHSISLL